MADPFDSGACEFCIARNRERKEGSQNCIVRGRNLALTRRRAGLPSKSMLNGHSEQNRQSYFRRQSIAKGGLRYVFDPAAVGKVVGNNFKRSDAEAVADRNETAASLPCYYPSNGRTDGIILFGKAVVRYITLFARHILLLSFLL
jgi:hypothetical protein